MDLGCEAEQEKTQVDSHQIARLALLCRGGDCGLCFFLLVYRQAGLDKEGIIF